MFLIDIERDVWRRLNKPDPPDPQTRARIKVYINQRHRTLLTMPGLNQLRRDTVAVQSTAGDSLMILPQIVNRVDAVFEQTQNRRLYEKPLEWLRTVDPQLSSGTPTHYVARGYQYEIARPTVLGELWVSSTRAEDIGVVRVEGMLANKFPSAGSATMAGTTLVRVGTDTNWSQLYKVFVSSPAVGFITVYTGTSPGPTLSTPMAVIEPGHVRPYAYIIQLWPVPTAALFYGVDYTRTITDMVEDTDQPYLPEDFHDLLSIGARQDEYEKVQDERFKIAVSEWNQRYAALQYFLQGRQSYRIIPHGMRGTTGINNLGGRYPADFYL